MKRQPVVVLGIKVDEVHTAAWNAGLLSQLLQLHEGVPDTHLQDRWVAGLGPEGQGCAGATSQIKAHNLPPTCSVAMM